jgi:5-methylcytosine-specific restriction endonuclease McrA
MEKNKLPRDIKGRFINGIAYSKGRKASEETKKRLSDSHKGYKWSEQQKINWKESRKNNPLTQKQKEYYSSKKLKEHMSQVGMNRKGKVSPKKGIPLTNETRLKISIANKGQKPWNYIDGRSLIVGPARYGDDWNKIRMDIYKRDNFSCQKCGITMTETKIPHHVHHIIPFLETFDNSYSNLITLCPSCHKKTESDLIRKRKKEEKLWQAK